jgi:hypothetical protein
LFFYTICFIQSFAAYSVEDQDEDVNKYAESRTHCLDTFEEYINTLKRQHGVIRSAASDPPTFDPGITVSHVQTISSNADHNFLSDNRTAC